jgi:arylformamidase
VLEPGLPTWPGSPGVLTTTLKSIALGDVANVTHLSMDVHSGTHVDAPRHFLAEGISVEELGLDPFIGATVVVDTGSAKDINASVLIAAAIPEGTERVLLRTANSLRSRQYKEPFTANFAALTLDGAEWLAERRLSLVGIDYLSIQRYTAPSDVHRVLLEAGIAILEGIELATIIPGRYELVCLPLRLANVDGSPARAILLPPSQTVER